jgi:hypothetical protein
MLKFAGSEKEKIVARDLALYWLSSVNEYPIWLRQIRSLSKNGYADLNFILTYLVI